MGVHFHGKPGQNVNIHGDVVGGDLITTTIVGAAMHVPRNLLEKAQEIILDAEDLEFKVAADLLKSLNALRGAFKRGDKDATEKAFADLEAKPGSKIITVIIQEMRDESKQ